MTSAKSRLRATLRSGEDVAVFTVRGTVLRDGDLLRGDDGRVVKIIAAAERPIASMRRCAPAAALRLPPRQSSHPGAWATGWCGFPAHPQGPGAEGNAGRAGGA
jgi:hypothetical protein